RASSSTSALYRSDLVGIQPMCRQVPPRAGHFSTRAVFSPSCAARMAATYPPGPLPMTVTSKLICDSATCASPRAYRALGPWGTPETSAMGPPYHWTRGIISITRSLSSEWFCSTTSESADQCKPWKGGHFPMLWRDLAVEDLTLAD